MQMDNKKRHRCIHRLLHAMLLDMGIPGKSQFRTVFLCPLMVPVASVVILTKYMRRIPSS